MTDDRLAGTLLGTALGDALGLPVEGMSARSIARRFGPIDRFRLIGRVGFVSDDTEQSALIAQSLARSCSDVDGCVRAFRRSLLGWFARLPWGVGRATILACFRIGLGMKRSGVRSAGNGAAMRAAIIGVFFVNVPTDRLRFGLALAEVTHVDARAVAGALYVGEMAARCAMSPPDADRNRLFRGARMSVEDVELWHALERASTLAVEGATAEDASKECGTSGFVIHTLAFATYTFLKHGNDPMTALTRSISAGGDTDSIAAILGGWLGALHGESGLPAGLIARIHDGPFGPTHLRNLAGCLTLVRQGKLSVVPRYSWPAAFGRNLLLYPVILAHGFRRLIPI